MILINASKETALRASSSGNEVSPTSHAASAASSQTPSAPAAGRAAAVQSAQVHRFARIYAPAQHIARPVATSRACPRWDEALQVCAEKTGCIESEGKPSRPPPISAPN